MYTNFINCIFRSYFEKRECDDPNSDCKFNNMTSTINAISTYICQLDDVRELKPPEQNTCYYSTGTPMSQHSFIGTSEDGCCILNCNNGIITKSLQPTQQCLQANIKILENPNYSLKCNTK